MGDNQRRLYSKSIFGISSIALEIVPSAPKDFCELSLADCAESYLKSAYITSPKRKNDLARQLLRQLQVCILD